MRYIGKRIELEVGFVRVRCEGRGDGVMVVMVRLMSSGESDRGVGQFELRTNCNSSISSWV